MRVRDPDSVGLLRGLALAVPEPEADAAEREAEGDEGERDELRDGVANSLAVAVEESVATRAAVGDAVGDPGVREAERLAVDRVQVNAVAVAEVGLQDPVSDCVGVRVRPGDRVWVAVGLAPTLQDRLGLCDTVGVPVLDSLARGEPVGVREGDGEREALSVRARDRVHVRVRVWEGVGAVREGTGAGLQEGDALRECVADAVGPVGLRVCEGVAVRDRLREHDVEWEAELGSVAVVLCDADGVRVAVRVRRTRGVGDGVGLGDTVPLRVLEAGAVAVGAETLWERVEGDKVRLQEAVRLQLGLSVRACVREGERLEEALAVGDSV